MALLLMLAAPQVRAALTPELWATRDSLALARAATGEAERLLVAGCRERDPLRLESVMRRLAGLEAPGWIRREALLALCEIFCADGRPDSLARRVRQLEAAGGSFSCPLAAPAARDPQVKPASESKAKSAAGGWWIQVGAFSSEKAARTALKAWPAGQRQVTREDGLWKARLGPFADRAAGERQAEAWRSAGRLREFRVLQAPAASR